MLAGVPGGRENPGVVVEADRRVAIRRALDAAEAGDVVVIAGKGHETYQEIAGRRLPFDDAVEARDALAARFASDPSTWVTPAHESPRRRKATAHSRHQPPAAPARKADLVLGLLVSGGIAMWAAILSTPFLIRYFRNRQIGQHIREDGPATHSVKAGTPTMGGIAIVGSVVFGYAVGHIGTEVRFSRTGYLAIGAVVAFGLIGYLDDYIKIHHRRSLGLNKRAKSGAQFVCALAFALLAVNWAHTSTALSFTRSEAIGIDMGPVLWVIFAVLVMVGASNAVNITDGVDGLAAGSGTLLLRRALDHGLLDLPALLDLPRAAGVGDRPVARLGRSGRCVHRVPVVERGAGQDHHGRHRLTGHRGRAGGAVPAAQPRAPAARSSAGSS